MEVSLQALGLNNAMCSAMWYITFQYICYITVYTSSIIKSRRNKCLCLILFSLLFLLLSCIIQIPGLYMDLWGLNAFSFAGGSIVSLYKDDIRLNKKLFLIPSSIFLILFYGYYFYLGNPDALWMRNPVKSIIAFNFVLVIVFYSLIYCKNIKSDLLAIVGKNSYYIYLVHAFFIFTLSTYAHSDNICIALFKLLIVIAIFTPIVKFIENKITKIFI